MTCAMVPPPNNPYMIMLVFAAMYALTKFLKK